MLCEFSAYFSKMSGISTRKAVTFFRNPESENHSFRLDIFTSFCYDRYWTVFPMGNCTILCLEELIYETNGTDASGDERTGRKNYDAHLL